MFEVLSSKRTLFSTLGEKEKIKRNFFGAETIAECVSDYFLRGTKMPHCRNVSRTGADDMARQAGLDPEDPRYRNAMILCEKARGNE